MPNPPPLETVGQYIREARVLLQDTDIPYRYPDNELIDGLNIGLMEARRLRADLFLPAFVLPWADSGPIDGPVPPATYSSIVNFDPMYRQALVYYLVGRMQLRDDEETTDTRASAFMQKFIGQLLSIQS